VVSNDTVRHVNAVNIILADKTAGENVSSSGRRTGEGFTCKRERR